MTLLLEVAGFFRPWLNAKQTMIWSPELDLIDMLTGCDEQLSLVCDLERAGRVLTIYAKKRVIVILRAADQPDTAVPQWELPSVFGNESNWQRREGGQPAYWVSLTDKGLKAFESGPDAWERLFER